MVNFSPKLLFSTTVCVWCIKMYFHNRASVFAYCFFRVHNIRNVPAFTCPQQGWIIYVQFVVFLY